MVRFQIAAPSDAGLLAATRQKVWNTTYRGIYPDERIDGYDLALHTARDKNRICDARNTVWLAFDQENCVGYCYVGPPGYGPYKDFNFCLNSLYFLPAYQGRGLGRRAFALVTAECLRRGYDSFFCGCNAHNRKARGFYAHMGGVLGAVSLGHTDRSRDQVYYEFTINTGIRSIT